MEDNRNVYRLQGLSCANCAAKFEKNIRAIETVEDVQLNFGAMKVTVQGDASIEQLEKAGAFDGIKVYPERERMKKPEPFWKKRENVAAMISLVFIIAGYLSYFQVGEKSPVTIGLFGLAILIGGFDLFKVGLQNLTKLEFDMKTLMTVAVIGAALIGEWAEGAVVVFLFAVSEALEAYSIDKARQSIKTLMEIAPNRATVRRGTEVMEIDVEDVRIGDIMLIKPGQKLAMDGEVIQGQSSVNQAAITGESIPVHKSAGDEVFAGTLNEEGALEVRVTKRSEDTTIAKIIHLVEEAQAERAPSQQFVDKFAKYYTPAIMVVALLVAVVPPLLFGASWSEWVYSGLAVLVVGCPCALVISTPVAIVTAIGNAARKGVLIKGGIHLEETGKLKVVAFDKTGTLTEGKPVVTDVVSLSDMDTGKILAVSRAIESYSQHPLASAIVRKAEETGAGSVQAADFQSITGKGAKASVGNDVYYIGSPILFDELLSVPDRVSRQVKDLQKQGKTVMLLGTGQEIKGLVAVADQLRKSSASIIQKLHKLGIEKTVMLTGDNEATGRAIGRQLGLSETRAELLPEDKLNYIRTLRGQSGNVAMVGDGVNDAPALAAATVGIAMGGAGTDAALETADVALMADDLEKLPYTIALSRKTLAIIKQNISFAILVKIAALLLVVPGWLTLWLAIFADMGATLIVVANSLRLLRTKE
ncbi:heavy metal translocating P-type ATPase [Bhargavaea beijingensis]|uniref:Cd(2+)-exporting ATPase n=1 Tax=Bhargavaea beijingensis TaxID=426756 RepID=A0A1G7E6U8_9BACL|nr:heavy metal translocating P-type ATPase [Bhargavaea beijingensis]MCW1927530.1 heavy metal translocating P-type ATPase [Bhargavaea beijingensis]RSK34916.1 cadmium-translocating P-type ATPase [Bhargavaea beijingensis]SDE59421.1 Cd2+/Zn2+-exporting ATPase [Bhargavaea beijingensis]